MGVFDGVGVMVEVEVRVGVSVGREVAVGGMLVGVGLETDADGKSQPLAASSASVISASCFLMI